MKNNIVADSWNSSIWAIILWTQIPSVSSSSHQLRRHPKPRASSGWHSRLSVASRVYGTLSIGWLSIDSECLEPWTISSHIPSLWWPGSVWQRAGVLNWPRGTQYTYVYSKFIYMIMDLWDGKRCTFGGQGVCVCMCRWLRSGRNCDA